jgi:hypothetical protein
VKLDCCIKDVSQNIFPVLFFGSMIAAPSSKSEEVHDPFLDYTQNIFAGLSFPEVPKNDIQIKSTKLVREISKTVLLTRDCSSRKRIAIPLNSNQHLDL